ncbi:MAG: bifunctional folylpolyglutamate synthase/dihydrofolate synthase [Ruminococcaceae bacterium]|nr:bifunctional folylpolyglutamate synthase/dihydrofolate synthase [Oscillospiraceae bacterium]
MTYDEALLYIHSVSNFFCKPGLERIKELCSMMGNPHEKLKFVHVAGTNGKGSFCAMLASILKESGYIVGLYTSPYILKFNERIAINGVMIDDNSLARLTENVKQFADRMTDKPTEFELITAIAFKYFAEKNCDIVVLECGLGGRYDATNIINSTILSVITGVSIDHTNFLGNTIKEIAGEKAGIIKKNTPCLYCSKNSEADEVITNYAVLNNSQLFTVDDNPEVIKFDFDGTVFNYKNYKNLFIKLLGSYQPINAINVINAVEILMDSGYTIGDKAIKDGLKNTVWHARFEKLLTNPLFIADGAHNPQGIDAAVDTVKKYFGDKKVTIITGVMRDKDYCYIAKKLTEISDDIICVTPSNPRALPAKKYSEIFLKSGVKCKATENINEAVKAAIVDSIKTNRPIISLGSLYMYGEITAAVEKYGIIS